MDKPGGLVWVVGGKRKPAKEKPRVLGLGAEGAGSTGKVKAEKKNAKKQRACSMMSVVRVVPRVLYYIN